MKFAKPAKTPGGLLFKLFRSLVTVKGIEGRMVNHIAKKQLSLRKKDFDVLKKRLTYNELTIKTFIWLCVTFLNIKHISIRVTVIDKEGETLEAVAESNLEDWITEEDGS